MMQGWPQKLFLNECRPQKGDFLAGSYLETDPGQMSESAYSNKTHLMYSGRRSARPR